MSDKKYISKINKGGQDLYIKDTEARANLDAVEELYCHDVYVMTSSKTTIQSLSEFDFYYNKVMKGKHLFTETSATNDLRLWYATKTTNQEGIIFTLNGIRIPIRYTHKITEDDVEWYVYQSKNLYGSLSVTIDKE